VERKIPGFIVGYLALLEFLEEVGMSTTQGDEWRSTLQEFVGRLELPFKDLFLLSRALTHRSYLNEHPEALEDNERLEFLGDAVLDFLVGAWLYNHFPEKSEGELTRLRSALVRTEQLAEFARWIELGTVMRLGKGEEDGGGRKRTALLCATFEALVGALYLESGIPAVRQFIEPLLAQAVDSELVPNNLYDPKSQFQEIIQARGFNPPVYRTVAAHGPDHAKVFEVEVLVGEVVYGHGIGRSKQSAAKAAAQAAIEAFDADYL
jgi:ribonuclease-3